MTEEIKRYTAQVKAVKDEGIVEGVFATFGVVDLDGDVTLPGAFGAQRVKIAAWGHNWGALPVGKGTIGEQGADAVFDAQFFLNTAAGLEHFTTIKELGDLQEWSYGFEVREAVLRGAPGFDDLLAQSGLPDTAGVLRFLLKMQVFEVSPVMRGAGIDTHTTLVKQDVSYVDQVEAVLAAVKSVAERSESLAELRAKGGRTLSAANRTRLSVLAESMRSVIGDVEKLLEPGTEKSVEKTLGLSLLIQRTLHDAERRMRIA